jgi:hypothetical protein
MCPVSTGEGTRCVQLVPGGGGGGALPAWHPLLRCCNQNANFLYAK